MFGNPKEAGDKGKGLLPDRIDLTVVQALKGDLWIGSKRVANCLTEFFSQGFRTNNWWGQIQYLYATLAFLAFDLLVEPHGHKLGEWNSFTVGDAF